MNDETKINVCQLRLIVGFLGERAQFNWWPTSFFESSSHLFLEPVFTKTTALAQYHGVTEAARRLHDEHLNVGAYHLFRLPEEAEHALHVLVQSMRDDDGLFHLLQSQTNAFESLKEMAGSNITVSEGPIAVGKIEDIDSVKALSRTAGSYWSAFNRNVKVYPYFIR